MVEVIVQWEREAREDKHGRCYLSGAKNFEFYPVCAAELLKPFKKGESMFHKGHWLWEVSWVESTSQVSSEEAVNKAEAGGWGEGRGWV